MSYEEFNKANKEFKKITESLYSFSKNDITQDEITLPKVTQTETISVYAKLKSHICKLWNSIKNFIVSCKLDKMSYFLFRKLKALIVFIYYAIPAVILIYAIIQICLFISTNVLTLSSNFDKGWNDNFIKSLPIMFQPAKYKFGQFITTVFALFIGIFMIQMVKNCGIYKWYIQLILNIISISIITALFLIPEKIYGYVAIIFFGLVLICMFGNQISVIFDCIFGGGSSGGSGGGSGGSSSSSSNYSSNSHSYTHSNSCNDSETTYEKTLKITKVTQFGNTVQIKVGNFINGKYDGTGTGYNKTGQLLGYGDSFVRIKENDGWIRTYGVRGEITNTEKL